MDEGDDEMGSSDEVASISGGVPSSKSRDMFGFVIVGDAGAENDGVAEGDDDDDDDWDVVSPLLLLLLLLLLMVVLLRFSIR